jgi:hypothetical protein
MLLKDISNALSEAEEILGPNTNTYTIGIDGTRLTIYIMYEEFVHRYVGNRAIEIDETVRIAHPKFTVVAVKPNRRKPGTPREIVIGEDNVGD